MQNRRITQYSTEYIGWQWRNFFLSYLCQLFFRHVVGQALQNVSYSGITFFVRQRLYGHFLKPTFIRITR